jgi:hypothetical protein
VVLAQARVVLEQEQAATFLKSRCS